MLATKYIINNEDIKLLNTASYFILTLNPFLDIIHFVIIMNKLGGSPLKHIIITIKDKDNKVNPQVASAL
jgi:hypothetical protein